MSRRSDSVPLRHMLDHAQEAVTMASGRTRGDLDQDRQFSLAILKLVEIVGEAGTRISNQTQAGHPEIPWRKITAARNRLVHGYDQVDHVVLWDIVKLDLPPLIEQLEAILADEPGGQA